MMIFVKLSSSLAFNIFTTSSDKPNRKKNIGKIFWRYSSNEFSPTSAKFSKFGYGNEISFQVKVFGRNIK